jgi:hypothetical protein
VTHVAVFDGVDGDAVVDHLVAVVRDAHVSDSQLRRTGGYLKIYRVRRNVSYMFCWLRLTNG